MYFSVRKYPGKYEFVIGPLCENLESLAKPEAKEAIIWILGEYPDRIENAGDLLYVINHVSIIVSDVADTVWCCG